MKINLEKCPAFFKFVMGLLVIVSGFLIADLPNNEGALGADPVFACSTAADCGTGQICSGGICSGGDNCVCGSWTQSECCDGTACTKGYREQTRTCTPSDCSFTERIVYDGACESENEGKCTKDSECAMENATCSCVSEKCLCCPTVNGVTGAVCEHDTEYCYYDANLQRCDEKGVYCGGNTAYPHFKCEAEAAEPKLKHILKELLPNGSVCSYFQKEDCCTGGICNADAGTCDAHAAAPVISNVSPEIDFKVSSDAEIAISAMTNINSICKYSGVDQDYDSMPNSFDNTGKKFHSDEIGKMTVGEHTFYVRCKGVNCVKNTTSAVIRFTVVDASGDKLAPKITNPLPSGDVDWENVTLSVETDEAATCHIDRKDKVAYEDMETTMGTTDSRHHAAAIDLTGYPNGTYTYYVKCKDLSGNTNDDSNQGKIIFDYTNGGDDDDDDDTTPPVISNLEPTDTISDNTPTIKADTDENATCRFSFADKSYDSMNDTFTKTGGQDHEFTFSSSLSDGAYTIYVRCKDDVGNKNTKSEKIEFIIDTNTGDDDNDDDSTDDDNDTTDDDNDDNDTTDDDDNDTTDDDNDDNDTTDDDSDDDSADDDIVIDGLTLTLVEPTSDITVDETDFIVATNHEATCRLSDKDQDYASMPWDFSTSDGKTHTVHLIQFDPGDSSVYVRCWDNETNTVMLKSAVFTVTYDAGEADDDSDDDTTIDELTMTLVEPTSAITVDETDFTISTNHNAVCRLSDQDQAYSSMPWQFSITGGKTHTVHLIQFDPGDSSVYVRCWDLETGMTSSKSAVFTVTYNSGGADDDDDTADDDNDDNDTTDDDDNDTTDDDNDDNDTTDDDDNDTTDDDNDDSDDDNDDWVDDDFGTDDDSADDDDNDDNDDSADDDDSTDDDNDDSTDDDDTDTTPPAISNAKPTGTVTASPLTVSLETDEVATCKLDLFDKEYDSMKMTFSKTKAKTHTTKVMALADGDYIIYVRCADSAGNKNTKSEKISFKVSLGGSDKIAPEITNPKPTGTLSSNDIEISVDTEKENATCKFDTQDNDYDVMASEFDESGGTHHTSEFMALGDGNYTIYVRCKDAAGNKNSSSTKIVFKIDSTSDFDDTQNDDSGDDENGGGQDEIVATKGDYVWQNDNAGTLGSFPWVNWYAGYEFVPQKNGSITELCGFFANKTQTISLYDSSFNELAASTVRSWNNWSCSAILPVSVAKNEVYYVAANINRSSVNFKYQCCDPALLPRVTKDVEVTAGIRQPNNKDFGPSLKRYSYLLFGLVDIKFNSGVGIKAQPSDTVAPIITDPQPSGTIANSKPTLSVKTDENATCRFEHAGVKYSSMKHAFSQTGGLTHTKTIGPLPDGNYIRYVRCKDQSGNKNTKSVKIKFTISGGGEDSTPPVISNAKPTGTIEDNETTISVETNENATCKFCATDSSYTSLCKTFDTTGKKNHSAEVGPLNDEDYVYYVRCKDKAGNVNTKSATIEFTVDAGSNDTTPPSVADIKANPVTGEIGDSFAITAKVTDNNDVKSVKAKIQQPDGTTVATITLYDDGSHGDGGAGDSVYGRKWLSTGRSAGKYYIDIAAVDEYDNTTTKDNGATLTLEEAEGGDDDDPNAECQAITVNGASSEKVDITFVPCGYGSDFTSLVNDAKKHIAKFSEAGIDATKFNFRYIKKSGIICGNSTSENLDNYGSQFRQHASACPTDHVIGFMKSAEDGGCAYMNSKLCFVNQSTSPFVSVHETGHAFFGLDDEYTYQGSCNRTVSGPNCDTSSTCQKWSGVSGTSCISGCTCSKYYRPASNCVMNQPSEGVKFCPVCLKSINSTLSSYK